MKGIQRSNYNKRNKIGDKKENQQFHSVLLTLSSFADKGGCVLYQVNKTVMNETTANHSDYKCLWKIAIGGEHMWKINAK